MPGVKETREMLVGVNEVAILMIKHLKDGFQVFKDSKAFYDHFKDSEEFREALEAAYENFKAIPEEIKDLDAFEGVELATVQLGYIPKILEAMKAE